MLTGRLGPQVANTCAGDKPPDIRENADLILILPCWKAEAIHRQ